MAEGLTVAVTGPTGTFGSALLPLLEAEPRVAQVVGIARRPFDPAARGWSKLTYVRGDVRDVGTLRAAFEGADVVVHLAFVITGAGGRERTRRVNVEGTRNVLDAAAAVGAARFVYASSVAAYGFHPDNPVGMTEDWPTRPARRLFYAREKAELEAAMAERTGGPDRYVLRPPIVLGPHAVGAKQLLPRRLQALVERVPTALGALRALPVGLPVPVPAVPLQVIHEDDVASALLHCVLGSGPPGAYNIAAEPVITARDVARELGLVPLPLPTGPVRRAARAASAVPLPSLVPAAVEWLEVLGHPVIVDTARARAELGWVPRHGALDAVRATLPGDDVTS
jgi:nucleoside-diphosphate-sugar epimerase